VRFIDRDQVMTAIEPGRLIGVMEEAFRAYASHHLPPSERLDSYLPMGEFHVKAGHAPGYFAVKANSAFFDNPPERPAIQGVIIAYDSRNGEPVAVIESGSVTALRTAAATAVAARALAQEGASTLALVGSGAQAWQHARALVEVLPLSSVRVWSRRPSSAAGLCRRIEEELGLSALPAGSPAEAVAEAQVIVCCTPSTAPLLWSQDVAPGSFIAAVGADSPHKQELASELTASATVITDLTLQCLTSGELHHAVSDGLMTSDDVQGELGQVLVRERPGRHELHEVVVFDSTGTGFQDAAAVAALLSAV
jgi:alanine dehydrogenase